jgi:hypothetical protein
MSSNTQTTSAAQVTLKRVRQSRTSQHFGSWWDLRYPTRTK